MTYAQLDALLRVAVGKTRSAKKDPAKVMAEVQMLARLGRGGRRG